MPSLCSERLNDAFHVFISMRCGFGRLAHKLHLGGQTKNRDSQFNLDAATALGCGCSSIFSAPSSPRRKLMAAFGLHLIRG
jgi:hypothetical protein